MFAPPSLQVLGREVRQVQAEKSRLGRRLVWIERPDHQGFMKSFQAALNLG
jgi:hypothetical protein